MKYFLDTNIVSYLMKKNPEIEKKMEALAYGDDADFCISGVTYYELKRGLIATNATRKIQILEQLLSRFKVVMMDFAMYEKSAEIYAALKSKGEIIEDDDIFIGATALCSCATLITNNGKHLSRIDGLSVLSW